MGGDELADEAGVLVEDGVEPAQVVLALVVEPLTERQRNLLTEIGDRTVEMLGTSALVSLVKRGLLKRSFIGQRWWRVRRTAAGRRAVEAERLGDGQ